MIREGLIRAGRWTEDRLRRMCGAMNPDRRVIAVVTLLLLFTVLSLYTTVTAIYRIGKSDGQRLRIEHMQRLEAGPEGFRADSLERQNIQDYERQTAKTNE